MFDGLFDRDALARADDAAVVAALEHWTRAEAASAAARLSAIGELMSRRLVNDEDERVLWSCDLWDCTAAEVGAAMNISHRRASGQMRMAEALCERLPKVAALFQRGDLGAKVASTIVWRTHLVDCDEAMSLIDDAIAERATTWGPISESALNQAIDILVEQHDPQARRRFRDAARARDVQFGKPDDSTGTASVWGRLYSTDATLLDRRLAEMTKCVCAEDPRTAGQRRADALGVLAAGSDRLACQCGNAECQQAGEDARAGSVVIHIVAEQAAAQADPDRDGEPKFKAALIVGGGVVPEPLLAELVAAGATQSPVQAPGEAAERRYRPSAMLDKFIRARDLTCRFPGCTRPAEYTDVDHTIAHPAGPTHPTNLKCLCRKHHLLKTFWTGPDGWSDRQNPDGTVVWTSPSGRSYTTCPGSRVVLPAWDVTTAQPPPPSTSPPTAAIRGRTLMMPTRKCSRAADRRRQIKAERELNDTS